jgi:type IV pilus assembly protein PilC
MTVSYRYVARNQSGERIEGAVAAENITHVAEHLRGRGLLATKITPNQPGVARLLHDQRYAGRDSALILVYRSLGILLDAGIVLRRALDILHAEMQDRVIRETIASMSAAVEAGRSLASAMQMHTAVFPELAISLVRAAEYSGTLSETLERYSSSLEHQRSLTRRIVGALIYPAIVLSAAISMLIAMVFVIMPTLASLFVQMNVAMPPIMRIGLALNGAMLHGGWAIVLLASAGCALFVTSILSRSQWIDLDRLRFQIPLFGRMQKRMVVARWARLLSSMLGAGVGIIEAQKATLPALHSPIYQREIERVVQQLEDGGSMADALKQSPWFEAMAVHLIAIGEETGSVDTNLFKLSELYERDVLDELTAAVALIEPCVVLVVGFLVGAVVLSIFVPLYSLIGNIQ